MDWLSARVDATIEHAEGCAAKCTKCGKGHNVILVYERQFLTYLQPAVYSLFCEDCQSDLTREENARDTARMFADTTVVGVRGPKGRALMGETPAINPFRGNSPYYHQEVRK